MTPSQAALRTENAPSSALSSASKRRWSVTAEPADALVVGTVGLLRISVGSTIKVCAHCLRRKCIRYCLWLCFCLCYMCLLRLCWSGIS